MPDLHPLLLSVEVALASLFFVAVAGVWAAHVLNGREFRGKDLLEAVLLLPLVLPPVVTGFGLLVLIGRRGIVGQLLARLDWQLIFTPYAAVLAASVIAFPLMYVSAKAAFLGVDSLLQDAARGLGGTSRRVFWTITLPLAWPGLAAGLLLTFARALGEFGATILVAGNIEGVTTTAPLAIYSAAEGGDLGAAGFYALILGVFNFILIIGLNAWMRRARQTRRNNEQQAKRLDTIAGSVERGAVGDAARNSANHAARFRGGEPEERAV